MLEVRVFGSWIGPNVELLDACPQNNKKKTPNNNTSNACLRGPRRGRRGVGLGGASACRGAADRGHMTLYHIISHII